MADLGNGATKLTPNMRTALIAVYEGRPVASALPGRGRNIDATLVALRKRGLLRWGRGGGTMGWEITNFGRDLVAFWKDSTHRVSAEGVSK